MSEGRLTIKTETRFNAIIEEYGKLLRSAIIRCCPRDLGIQFDDIEQEARLRLWRALESEREIHDLASYIYRIAATTTIDAVRRVKAKREGQLRLTEDEEDGDPDFRTLAADPGHAPDRIAERQQIIQKVRDAIARLPDDRQRAVSLYLEGLTSQEIADLMGWSEARARNLTYRGLKTLRDDLKAEGIDYEIE